MAGNLGAALGIFITGQILAAHTVKSAAGGKETVEPTGFVICFAMYAVVYGLGVLSWLLIDPTKPVVSDVPVVPREPEEEQAW
jgi:hypothetical protein